MLAGRDPEAMLGALDAPSAKLLVACTPPSPRALPASEVAKAAVALDVPEVVAVPDVDEALARALSSANEDELVLVTGSLYTVGAARPWLLRRSGRPLR
jgi:dihydrofolate synthase/folylpolyglutamate synthase